MAAFNDSDNASGEATVPGQNPNPIGFGSSWVTVPEGGYKTLDVYGNPTYQVAPDFNEMLNHALVHYQNTYGSPLDRPWNTDPQVQAFGNQFLNYANSTAQQWNMLSGQNISSPWASLGDLPVSEYAASLPAEHKGSSSMLGGAISDPVVQGMLAFAGGTALTGPGAAAGGATDLSGPLISQASRDAFLAGVPNAVPGTMLTVGGVPVDIGAVGAGAGLSAGALANSGVEPDWASLADTGYTSGPAATPSFLQQLQNFLSSPFESVSNAFGGRGGLFGNSPLSTAYSIGSGIYGMIQQNDLRRKALEAMKLSDPWGASGGRATADAALQKFLADPNAAAANDPAYKLRMQAAMRANAMYGQGSGKMAVAAADASTDWYNTRLAQLGGLAGTGFSPATGASIGLQGESLANDLASKSLASIGYGIGGGGQGIPPALQQALALRMMQIGGMNG